MSSDNSSINSVQLQTSEKQVIDISHEPHGTISNKEDKGTYKIVTSRDADVTLKFQEQYDGQVPEITEAQEAALSRKVYYFIVSFTALVNLLLYMDKATLSYAAILGLFEDTGLDNDKYSNINTVFYCGFIAGQIPGHYLLQKLPIGKFLAGIIFSWSVIVFLTCTAHNYAGVLATRFFLGFMEASVLPLLNVTMGQFLTVKEKAASAPLFYATCLGNTIPTGFIAYGVLHAKSHVSSWKFFMIIIGGLTFVTSILVFFFYPNNPSEAKFLSIEERIWVIRRVQDTTGSSIEQKVFKKYQCVETLKDSITWLFALFNLLQMLANNLPYQQNLLFTEMGGISNLDSTLVSVASGGFAVVCCLLSSYSMDRFSNITAFSVVFWSLPSLIGSLIAVALPWENKVGLLAALCLASPVFGIPWVCMFSWNMTSCSGYTKKLTRNAIGMIFYCISNIISPQLWKSKDAPRYYPAWAVQIVLSFFIAPCIALVIYYILNKRNKERLSMLQENDKVGYVEDNDNGFLVNVAALDLTDLENKAFIYPL